MTQLLGDVDVAEIRGDASRVEISAVDFDSRLVIPGSLFCCVTGARTDGHDHAPEAVAAGASALLCERFLDLDVVQARLAPGRMRSAMAEAAAALHGYPARDLQMVGVTGTNGKTTVTQLVRSILDIAGRPTGVIGTLDGERTTPESPVLQGLLADLALQLSYTAFGPTLLPVARKSIPRPGSELPPPAVQHVGIYLQRPRRFADGHTLFQPPYGGQFELFGELPT